MANVHGLRDLESGSNNSGGGRNPFVFSAQPGQQASQEEENISAPFSKNKKALAKFIIHLFS